MIDEEINQEALKPQGPGACLRLERENKNISLEDMAKQLRLSSYRLTQIEHGDYGDMGAPAFARGYLWSYARALGIPEDNMKKILMLFDEQDLAATIPSNKPKLLNERITTSSPKATRRVGYLVLATLIAFVAFWWHTRGNNLGIGTNGVAGDSGQQNVAETASASADDSSEKAVLQTTYPLETTNPATVVPSPDNPNINATMSGAPGNAQAPVNSALSPPTGPASGITQPTVAPAYEGQATNQLMAPTQ